MFNSKSLAFCLLLPAAGLRAAPAEGKAVGTLDVWSEPAGAAVYVDGKFSGHAPVKLELAAGEHRVKVAKIGYLDKARLVRIRPGEPTAVNISLTATSVTAVEAAKGGGKRKLALIGLGALAAGTATYLVANRNHAPVAGIIIANPYTALAGVMNVTFRADDARDDDHDPLTYQWAFGDGSQAEGRAVNHIYASAGSYTVTLTVSDGKDSSSSRPSPSWSAA